ncbi:MAG: SDR family oxidoreductase [Candidatus Rokubacteria bacterium]|nr:SDR family oxidoreductase [Candidatus Rokubacteria bacterium]MBI3824515.1 SDR family oxidoreductase [Candidatus Rokubacteria bacterium]
MSAFDGQVAFVTGASSGIGAALARALARQGADVALAARRTDRLAGVAADVRRAGRRAVITACDVTRDGDVERAVAETLAALGRIDVVVANAGFGVVGPFESLDLDAYRRQFETNVFGVIRTLRAGLDAVKRARGTLVIMGSVSGHVGFPGSSAYCMSKFAVRALAESLRFELAPAGVSVVLISPGFVDSEIHQVDNHGLRHAEARHPAPRWLLMDADRAARQIVRAIVRRRRERVITGHGKLVVFLQRHVPGLLAAGVGRSGARSRPEPR